MSQPITVEPFTLTPEQELRFVKALAIFDARRAALRRGVPLAEVQAKTWLVHVDAIEADLAEEQLTDRNVR